MNQEGNPDEAKPEEKFDFKKLSILEKIIVCIVVFFKAIFSWLVLIGAICFGSFFSSMGEHTSLGESHEDAYQGGRFIWLIVGAILIGTGIANNIKKMRS